MRKPVVAGSFYPDNKKDLEKIIKKFLTKSEKRKCKAIIAPHAGYVYCGKTLGKTYSSIEQNFDTVIILGVDHYGFGSISTTTEDWETPLGIVKIDKEFIDKLPQKFIRINHSAHLREHSIEVQLPWLQYLFKDFKFVPISINPIYFDKENTKQIGRVITKAAKNKRVLIIASSDFTHHGSMYAYSVYRGHIDEILKKIKENDLEIAKAVCNLESEKVIELSQHRTICGYGCIGSAIEAAKLLNAKSGKIIDYTTSYEITKDKEAIVAYCGIVTF